MIPLEHGLILAAILFVMGLSCLVIRRNLLFMLIGLEIMINSTALAFVVAGSFGGSQTAKLCIFWQSHWLQRRRVLDWRCYCNSIVIVRT